MQGVEQQQHLHSLLQQAHCAQSPTCSAHNALLPSSACTAQGLPGPQHALKYDTQLPAAQGDAQQEDEADGPMEEVNSHLYLGSQTEQGSTSHGGNGLQGKRMEMKPITYKTRHKHFCSTYALRALM